MLSASTGNSLRPQLVFEIEGLSTVYSTGTLETVSTGGFVYTGGFSFGGLTDVDDQKAFISFSGGTSTAIKQQLRPDKGTTSSISSMRIALVDKDGFVSENVVSPDETVSPAFDVLGRRVKVWFGFAGTSYQRDYIVVFRGSIESIICGAGLVTFTITSPDSKKKGEIFAPAKTELNGSLTDVATSMTVLDTSDFLDSTFTGPDGTIDTDLVYGCQIDDEVIIYAGQTATTFTSLTRGQFGTVASSHSSGAAVESFYILGGSTGANSIDIALKLLLGGRDAPYAENVDVESFVLVDSPNSVANAIWFAGLDLIKDLNVTVGDFVTVTGAANGANNITDEAIDSITTIEDGDALVGSYAVINNSVTLVSEASSAAVIDFQSQFDVWPVGAGAAMNADEVDVAEHLKVQSTF